MKKLIAVALSLVLVLAVACTACAEIRSFELSAILDADGNVLEVEEMPEAIITLEDDEAAEVPYCAYTTAEATEEGTYTVVETDEESQIVTLSCVFEEETLTIGYDAETNMCYMYADEDGDGVPEQSYIYTMVEAE